MIRIAIGHRLNACQSWMTAGPNPVGSNADDFCDGLHLGLGGNRKVFQRIQARLREHLHGDEKRMKQLLPVRQTHRVLFTLCLLLRRLRCPICPGRRASRYSSHADAVSILDAGLGRGSRSVALAVEVRL